MTVLLTKTFLFAYILQDAMERVFHDMNIGSVRCIHKYYQNRVIKYHEKILEECKNLNCEYNNISIPIKTEALALDTIT